MRRMVVFFVVVSLVALALPAAAQQAASGGVVRLVVLRAKPGMEKQYEEGRKRHIEWHKKQNDTWSWQTWQVETGDNLGEQVSATFGHNWADFDARPEFDAADDVDFQATVGPYVETVGARYYLARPEVSRPAGEAPAKMSVVYHFHLNMGMAADFEYAIKKIHEAIGKTNWPVNYMWYTLLNGGEHPTYVVVLPRNKWAEFAPPEKPFDKMLEEAYGRREAESLIKLLDKSTHCQKSEILTYRADLSYVPAKK